MSDVKRYVQKRAEADTEFAQNYEAGYADFKIGVILRQARESAGLTQETGDYNNLLNVATQVIADQSNVSQAGALNATQFRNKYLNTGIFVQEEASIIDAVTLTAGVRFDRSSNNGDASKSIFYNI